MIRRPIRRWFPLFMGPMVCAFIIGFVYPFCKGIYLSFCKFKVTSDAHFVGLENYRRAFQDASFVHSFWFTALFAVISLVLINVLAFAVAYALTQGIKGSNLYRTVFFMPNLIGGIVLGYIWSMIFDGFLVKYNTSVVLNSTFGFWGAVDRGDRDLQHRRHGDGGLAGQAVFQEILAGGDLYRADDCGGGVHLAADHGDIGADILGGDGGVVAGDGAADQRLGRASVWHTVYGHALWVCVSQPSDRWFSGGLAGRQDV